MLIRLSYRYTSEVQTSKKVRISTGLSHNVQGRRRGKENNVAQVWEESKVIQKFWKMTENVSIRTSTKIKLRWPGTFHYNILPPKCTLWHSLYIGEKCFELLQPAADYSLQIVCVSFTSETAMHTMRIWQPFKGNTECNHMKEEKSILGT